MTASLKRLWPAAAGALLLLTPLFCAAQVVHEADPINQLLRNGQHAEAAAMARTALATLAAAGQSDSLEAASLLAKLARALWAGGKVKDPETRRSAERALALREKLLGPDHPQVGSSLADLATVLRLLGDYAGALPLAERAVAIERKAKSASAREAAEAIDGLGVIRYRTGNMQGALEAFSEALAIYEKSAGPDSLEAAQALSDVAVAQLGLGNAALARSAHERALAIRRRKLDPDHFLIAASLNNLAGVLERVKDLRGALALLEEALRIREKSLAPEHPNIANGLYNLGRIRLRLGEYGEAVHLFERSLAMREKAYGPWHWETAQALEILAAALRGQGKAEQALEADLRADSIFRNHARYSLRTLSEQEAVRFLDTRLGLDTSLALAAQGALTTAQTTRVWDALLRSRGLVFDEMVVRRASLAKLYPTEEAAAVGRLDAARSRLAAELAKRSNDPKKIAEIRTEVESAERVLALKSLRFRRELQRASVGFDEVVQALPLDSALVAFASYRAYNPSQDNTERRVVAFVYSMGSEAAAVPIGRENELEALVIAWRKELIREAESAGRSSRRNEASYRRAGEALRRRIWDPVATHLRGVKRVFVVPDGALHLVNFVALPVTNGRYLAESGPVIHLLNTERDVAESLHERSTGTGLLAVGNPDYDMAAPRRPKRAAPTRGVTSHCLDLEQLHFDRLAGSGVEVDGIAGLWPSTDGGVTVLKGQDATQRAVRRGAGGKRVLHLATHGFFYDRPCGGGSALAQSWQLSGVALAGANRRGDPPGQGIMTAESVAALTLDGVEWVVLSGCDTGLGRVEPHEGVFGLRRAFQLAGARTVIMSLWPVDDESTREWMLEMYRARLKRKLDTSQSVRDASVHVLRSRRAKHLSTHPFYWAGFVAAGAWE
jgi:CHAT domain-containing protein/Tfp pilus assembly protein PilF